MRLAAHTPRTWAPELIPDRPMDKRVSIAAVTYSPTRAYRCALKFGVLRKYGEGSGMSHAPFPTNLLPLPTTFAV